MRRLALLLLLIAAPAAAQTDSVHRLGLLASTRDAVELTRRVTLPELARLGFSEGRNLVLDAQFGDTATLARAARDLVFGRADAIIAIGPDALRAAYDATRSVPIVSFGSDPVEMGMAANVVRPGGNVTGVTILGAALDGKRLDVLREAVPGARRVAALLLSSAGSRQASERAMRAVAADSAVELLVFDVAGPDDYAAAFAGMRVAEAQGLVIMATALFNRDAERLAQLAAEHGLPTVCEWAELAQVGCLLGYGPSRTELRRRLADYVARIFRGTAIAEIPIETPMRFEFAINLRTARTLGLTVPPTLLVRADEVIE